MKKYIRFFANKEDGIPVNSYQMLKSGASVVSTAIQDNAETTHAFINGWMDAHPNGKVDFVWLP